MRPILLSVIILLLMVSACRSDQTVGPVNPTDGLYRQWSLFQLRYPTSTGWMIVDTDAYYTVDYQPDGTMLYRRNGLITQNNCCKPTKFNRQGSVLTYTDWQLCPNALCGVVKQATITQLTHTLLELNDGYTISQYESAK